MRIGEHAPHRVAVLVRHGVLPMELGLVHQVFSAARDDEGAPLYEVVTCALTPGAVRTDADFPIHVAAGPDTLPDAATVVIPATHEEGAPELEGRLEAPLADALARISPGARIASICTGAFVLAAAGMLEGRPATTHWESTAKFRRLFPGIALHPGVLYTEADGVLTSAGEAAGIDLCLHMVRRDFGAAVANRAARSTVTPPHREGGQAQYIPHAVPIPERRSSTAAARTWALERLHRPLNLNELAQREAMSVRTFTRRFRQETGLTPVQWLTQRRIDRARQLLEETDLPVDRVAAEAGFGTAASLRQHLHAAIGVSPTAYRTTFRGAPHAPACSVTEAT